MNNLKKWFEPLPLGAKAKWLEEAPILEGESELIKAWKGLAPRGVAKEMATEYLRRFPSPILPEGHITDEPESNARAWLKWIALKSNTWADLEQKLKYTARLCRERKADLFYWDRMRYIFRKLPNLSRRRISRSVSLAMGKHRLEDANPIEDMVVCRLCWRAAPQRRGQPWAYCQLSSPDFEGHVLSKEHNKRRRLQRSKSIRPSSFPLFTADDDPLFEQLYPSRLMRIIMPGDSIADPSRIQDVRLDELWLRSPGTIIQHLPHVYEYLTARKADLMSTKSIITTLEGPAPTKQSEEEKTARDSFYQACESHYYMYLPHLVWAEIWLRYEASLKGHGGARRGAGRPTKAAATTFTAQTEDWNK